MKLNVDFLSVTKRLRSSKKILKTKSPALRQALKNQKNVSACMFV